MSRINYFACLALLVLAIVAVAVACGGGSSSSGGGTAPDDDVLPDDDDDDDNDATPPLGACCQGASCSVGPFDNCPGSWMGADTVCVPNPCIDDDNDNDDASPDDDDNDNDDASPDDDDNDNDDTSPDDDDTAEAGFAFIRHGAFTMGSPPEEPGRASDETLHDVTLTRDFEMSVYETKQVQFKAVMGWNPSSFPLCGDDCPVERVSWYDALAYANQLSTARGYDGCFLLGNVVCADTSSVGTEYMTCMNAVQGGIESATVTLHGVSSVYDCQGYRLPTESEWEYAARAGTTTAFYNGGITSADCTLDPKLNAIAWYCGNDDTTTKVVGQKLPNAWGLSDMSGNVWEWTWDRYGPYPGARTDPAGPGSGSVRVFRGGSWIDYAGSCRSAGRDHADSGFHNGNLGFRLVRTLPDDDDDDACGPSSCPSGCCDGAQCLPGFFDDQCGKNGAACVACNMGDGCVGHTCVADCWTDPTTGLMWQNGTPDMSYCYDEAMNYCVNLIWGGYNGWRLPDIDELRSLVRGCAAAETGGSCDVTNSCLSYASCWNSSCNGCPAYGGPGPGGAYWPPEITGAFVGFPFMSSSAVADASGYAWEVNFSLGGISDPNPNYCNPARCVR